MKESKIKFVIYMNNCDVFDIHCFFKFIHEMMDKYGNEYREIHRGDGSICFIEISKEFNEKKANEKGK